MFALGLPYPMIWVDGSAWLAPQLRSLAFLKYSHKSRKKQLYSVDPFLSAIAVHIIVQSGFCLQPSNHSTSELGLSHDQKHNIYLPKTLLAKFIGTRHLFQHPVRMSNSSPQCGVAQCTLLACIILAAKPPDAQQGEISLLHIRLSC